MKTFALIFVILVFMPLDNLEPQGRRKSARRPKPGSGAICVAEVPPPEPGQSRGEPYTGGEIPTIPFDPRPAVYSIQVDTKPPVVAPNDGNVRIPGLAMGRRHLVKIYGDGKLIESFWFRFDDFETKELCLWFDSMYATWSLSDAKDGGSTCRCDHA